MMITDIIWPECLYKFLRIIERSTLEKNILDCGAGGTNPPLTLFKQKGYETYGIDVSPDSLEAAKKFEEKYDINLGIRHGDMRYIPFDDDSFSFVYTLNSLCHLSKKDHLTVLGEIQRVLKPKGYCMIDFMSADSSYCNEEEMGELVGNNEYRMRNRHEEKYHSFFLENEPEKYLHDLDVIRIDKVSIKYYKPHQYTDIRYYYFAQKS